MRAVAQTQQLAVARYVRAAILHGRGSEVGVAYLDAQSLIRELSASGAALVEIARATNAAATPTPILTEASAAIRRQTELVDALDRLFVQGVKVLSP